MKMHLREAFSKHQRGIIDFNFLDLATIEKLILGKFDKEALELTYNFASVVSLMRNTKQSIVLLALGVPRSYHFRAERIS
jgi:hypothetical protein